MFVLQLICEALESNLLLGVNDPVLTLSLPKVTFCLWCSNAKMARILILPVQDHWGHGVCLTTDGMKPVDKLKVQNYLEHIKCLIIADCCCGESCTTNKIATGFSVPLSTPSFSIPLGNVWLYRWYHASDIDHSIPHNWPSITQKSLELSVTSDTRYKHTHTRKQGALSSCEDRSDSPMILLKLHRKLAIRMFQPKIMGEPSPEIWSL